MMEDNANRQPSNIPIPDPSIATAAGLRALRDEVKGWVEALQILHEKMIASTDSILNEKIKAAEAKTDNLDRVVQTRLAGSETALNAAMAAADKVTQKIETTSLAVLNELKAGMSKQIDLLNEKIEDLKKRVFESGGRAQGVGSMASMIISAVAALAAVVSVVIVLSRPAPEHSAPQGKIERQGF